LILRRYAKRGCLGIPFFMSVFRHRE